MRRRGLTIIASTELPADSAYVIGTTVVVADRGNRNANRILAELAWERAQVAIARTEPAATRRRAAR